MGGVVLLQVLLLELLPPASQRAIPPLLALRDMYLPVRRAVLSVAHR